MKNRTITLLSLSRSLPTIIGLAPGVSTESIVKLQELNCHSILLISIVICLNVVFYRAQRLNIGCDCDYGVNEEQNSF